MAKTAMEQMGTDLPEPEPHLLPAHPEPPAEEPERPGWLPAQYESPEAFAQAHKSAQDKIREQGEELSRLRQEFDQLQAAREEQPQRQHQQQNQYDPDSDPRLIAWERALEEGDHRLALAIQADIARQAALETFQQYQQQTQASQQPHLQAQQELFAIAVDNHMRQQYPDWEDMSQKIADEARADPDLIPDSAAGDFQRATRALTRAYDLVKFREAQQEQRRLAEQGVQQADVGAARKLMAQTVSGASGRPGEPPPGAQKLAEMQAALRGDSYVTWRNSGGR